MTNGRDLDLLIEAAASAYRERDRDGRILAAPAWHDLPVEAREALYEAQSSWRALERAFNREGLSATVRAVLARIAG